MRRLRYPLRGPAASASLGTASRSLPLRRLQTGWIIPWGRAPLAPPVPPSCAGLETIRREREPESRLVRPWPAGCATREPSVSVQRGFPPTRRYRAGSFLSLNDRLPSAGSACRTDFLQLTAQLVQRACRYAWNEFIECAQHPPALLFAHLSQAI